MNDADKELAALLRNNPELRVIEQGRTDGASFPTTAQFYAQQAERITAAHAAAHAAISAQLADNAQPYEPEMQAEVIAWADAQGHPALRWLAHIPNGGYRPKSTLGSIPGVKAGIPDLVLWWSRFDAEDRVCPGLAIEMKRKPNKPSDKQLEWIAHLRSEGWRCEVCYSAQAAIGVLKEYLEIT